MPNGGSHNDYQSGPSYSEVELKGKIRFISTMDNIEQLERYVESYTHRINYYTELVNHVKLRLEKVKKEEQKLNDEYGPKK